MKTVRAILIAAFLVAACLCGVPLLLVTSTGAAAAVCGPAGAVPTAVPSGDVEPVGRWDARQMRNAAIVVAVGEQARVPRRGWVVAAATMMQESKMLIYANDNPSYPLLREQSLALPHQAVGRDHDSVGLFQQRVSPPAGAGSWGTAAELMDPKTSANKFYGALQKVVGWEQMTVVRAAQSVQRSAFPDAYAQWERDAEQVVAAVAGVGAITDLPGASLIDCTGAGPVASSGWVQPVPAKVTSGFRTAERPDHHGVDLGAGRNTAIRAASGGEVILSECNSSSGTCDADGSPSVRGCGWYVQIRHAGDLVTMYCHMVRKPDVQVGATVRAGDVIGMVGSSGNSSGPHLHFEVHRVPAGQYPSNSNAISPEDHMRSVGAPL